MPDSNQPRDTAAVQQDQHRASIQAAQADTLRRARERQAQADAALAPLQAAQQERQRTYTAAQTAAAGQAARPPVSSPSGVAAPSATGVVPAPNPPPADNRAASPTTRTARTAQDAHSRTVAQRTAANPNLNRIQNTPAATTPTERDATVAQRNSVTQSAEGIVARQNNHTEQDTLPAGRALFEEQAGVQVMYHDFIVYIQGADVTSYVQGSISITQGVNETANQASFTLANTGNMFTITPENVAGKWRLSPDEPFSEYAKKKVYDFKRNPNRNPTDLGSGTARWNLMLNAPVFHRQDPVRIWVHHPTDEGDFWLPKFTGYITSKAQSTDHNTTISSISITAADIRDLMKGMRVQRNTINSAEVREQTELGLLASGQEVATRRAEIQLGGASGSTLFRTVQEDIRARANANNGQTPLTPQEILERCNDALLAATRGATGIRLLGDLFRDYIPGNNNGYTFAWARMTFTQISHAMTVGGTSDPYNHAVNRRGTNRDPSRAQANGDGGEVGVLKESIGRFREGLTYLYPDPDANRGGNGRTPKQINADILEHWYRLCLFGSPIRRPCTDRNIQTRLAPSVATQDCRFWTEAEVHGAGRLTQTDGVWAPDMQLTHWLLPVQGDGTTSTENGVRSTDGLFEVTVLGGGGNHATNVQRDFTNRLAFLMETMTAIDYRMYVTGAGDIVFEFPMYDFFPDDFGLFRSVLEVEGHLLNDDFDDEHGDYPTVVLVQGSFTGLNQGGPINTGTTNLKPPTGIAMSLGLASRRGFIIDRSHTYNWIRDPKKLTKLANLTLQKEIMNADSFSMGLASRVFLLPNKPLHNLYLDRIGLIDSLTHAWEVFGEASTSVDLKGSRGVDIYGVRRSLTGGRSLPISFAQIPGTQDLAARRQLQTRVRLLLRDGLTPDDIVFGYVQGGRLIPAPVNSGDPPGTPKTLSPENQTELRNVRAALRLGRQGSGVTSIEDQRRRHRLGNTTAAELLNQTVAYTTVEAGDDALNVADGFQTEGTNTYTGASNQTPQAALAQTNREGNANAPPGIQPPYQNAAQEQEASGIANLPAVLEDVGAAHPLPRPVAIRNLAAQTRGARTGDRTADRSIFLTLNVPLRRVVYGCVGCDAHVDFWRKNDAALRATRPGLTQVQRNFAMAQCYLEEDPKRGINNFNFMNAKAYPEFWMGPWYYRPEGHERVVQEGVAPSAILVRYKSFETAEEGWDDWYVSIHNSRYARAGALFDRGNPLWCAALYSLGWSDAFDRWLHGRRSSLDPTGATAEELADFTRLPPEQGRTQGAYDPNNPAYIAARQRFDILRNERYQAQLEVVNSAMRRARTAPPCDPLALASYAEARRREVANGVTEDSIARANAALVRPPTPPRTP